MNSEGESAEGVTVRDLPKKETKQTKASIHIF